MTSSRTFRRLFILPVAIMISALVPTRVSRAEARANPAGPVNIRVEVVFIEVDPAKMAELEKKIGFALWSQAVKAVLTSQMKEKLVRGAAETDGAQILGSLSAIAKSDATSVVRTFEEVRFPKEIVLTAASEKKESDGGHQNKASGALKMDIGSIGLKLKFTARLLEGDKIDLTVKAKASIFLGWVDYKNIGVSQPLFAGWSVDTTLLVPDGKSLVMTLIPSKEFEDSYVLTPSIIAEEKGTKRGLIIISAGTIDD